MIRICIVDDDSSVRKSLANLLKSAGYQTIVFASGEEFLDSPASAEAACVLLDLRMRGLQGLEVQQVLKARAARIGVICMSAHDDPDSVSRALAAGAACFLRKPFSEAVLLRSIMTVLDHP